MFVHLRLHTEFSVVDGTNRIDEVVKAAARRRPAGAGHHRPDQPVRRDQVLQGRARRGRQADDRRRRAGCRAWATTSSARRACCCWCRTTQGYLNLCELLARAWTAQRGSARRPCVKWEWLRELGEGLIALSGAAGRRRSARRCCRATRRAPPAVALQLAALFPQRFYIELQRAGLPDDEAHVRAAVQLAARLQPAGGGHAPGAVHRRPTTTRRTRRASASPKARSWATRAACKRFTREQYFKTPGADGGAVRRRADRAGQHAWRSPSAATCMLELGKPQLPDFPTPDRRRRMPIEEYFRIASHEGLEERLAQLYPDAAERDARAPALRGAAGVRDRHHPEDGLPGLLPDRGATSSTGPRTTAARSGPGRGSGAGSLVAYALKITDLDPLQYNLLFERFLNPERVSMPDFDIDFCQGNRDRVIDYVKDKYGRDAVSQIATFGTMAAKAALRDVGRVLGMGYGHVDGIAKLIPAPPGKTVTLRTRARAARPRRDLRAQGSARARAARGGRGRSGRAAGAGRSASRA